MAIKKFECLVKADIQSVWNFHSSAEALAILTPPNRKMKLVSSDLAVREGAVHELRIRLGPFYRCWKARLTMVNPPNEFTDTAEKSPFKSWRHRHQFLERGDETVLKDTVEYALPFGKLGELVDKFLISREIDRLFAFRHAATRRALEHI